MYSGRLTYQRSCSATSGESSASSMKPTRMRCHRSGSGIGTSRSSKADGSVGGGKGAGGGAEANATVEARAIARDCKLLLKCIRLVFVL